MYQPIYQTHFKYNMQKPTEFNQPFVTQISFQWYFGYNLLTENGEASKSKKRLGKIKSSKQTLDVVQYHAHKLFGDLDFLFFDQNVQLEYLLYSECASWIFWMCILIILNVLLEYFLYSECAPWIFTLFWMWTLNIYFILNVQLEYLLYSECALFDSCFALKRKNNVCSGTGE